MAVLALTFAACAVFGFGRAAVTGSAPALAVGVVDSAAAAVVWLAGRVG